MEIRINHRLQVAKIERDILVAFRDHLNIVFKQAAPGIRRRIVEACDGIIEGTKEYASLVRGELMAELGLENPESRMAAVIGRIKESVQVVAKPVRIVGKTLTGGITGELLREDFEDILSLAEASYVSQPSGAHIPWLGWLITGGDQILVFDHRITYDLTANQALRSRSGAALMIPGSGWRVPPEYAGTIDSNFLTKAFDLPGVEKLIVDIVVSEIQSRI